MRLGSIYISCVVSEILMTSFGGCHSDFLIDLCFRSGCPQMLVCVHTFSPLMQVTLLGYLKLRKGGEAEAQNRGLTPRAAIPSATGGMGPATQPRHLNLEATGVWGKTFSAQADGGMNSAAGSPPAPPLPCVHGVTSSNASHN